MLFRPLDGLIDNGLLVVRAKLRHGATQVPRGKHMRKIHLVVLAGVVALSSTALAQEEEAAPAAEGESSVNTVNEPVKEAAKDVQTEMGMKDAKAGYGNAGCGLGSLLFDPSNGFTQVFAATTNGTSGTQTFGITSGTSNCDASGYQAGSTAAYIQTNRAALAKDVARGKGATVAGLSDLAGCTSSKAVGKKLQRNFKVIFSDAAASDKQVSDRMITVLKSDQALACTNLI
jgi:hypothetical protein